MMMMMMMMMMMSVAYAGECGFYVLTAAYIYP
jgi:hypothetical protein